MQEWLETQKNSKTVQTKLFTPMYGRIRTKKDYSYYCEQYKKIITVVMNKSKWTTINGLLFCLGRNNLVKPGKPSNLIRCPE